MLDSDTMAEKQPAKRRRGQRLTQADKMRIVEERQNGRHVAVIAADHGHSQQTIIDVWREWLGDAANRDPEEILRIRYELVFRHEQAAHEARVQGQNALADGKYDMHARYLSQERQSLQEIAKLTGADQPQRIEITGEIVHSDAKERLSDYLSGLVQ